MEDKELIPINIGNINDGAMIEGFDLMFRKVLDNIADLNTPATATRSLTLTLTIKPHSDRTTVDTEVACSTKLAAVEVHKSKCFVGKEEGGGMVAFTSDPRQMQLWTAPRPKEAIPVIRFESAAT